MPARHPRGVPPPPARTLTFGHGNAKLDPAVTTFGLPAGHACPHAAACRARADPRTGRVRDGPGVLFRCYAASQEARHPAVRRARWRNLRLLRRCRTAARMAALILDSLSPAARLVRVHDAGDFFSPAYLDAWLAVARARPRATFYAYTKALPWWVARLDQLGDGHAPGAVPNVVLTASHGGTHDHLIAEHGLRSARVVFSAAEAAALGLAVDHDDSHAMEHRPDFALLLHGTQPAGSAAAAAARRLRAGGFAGYGPGGRVTLPVVGG